MNRRFSILFVWLGLMQAVDWVTTKIALANGYYEQNMFVRLIIEYSGGFAIFAAVKFACFGLLYGLFKISNQNTWMKVAVVVSAAAATYVAAHNVMLLSQVNVISIL